MHLPNRVRHNVAGRPILDVHVFNAELLHGMVLNATVLERGGRPMGRPLQR
jgi:hypothetical protein